MLATLPVVVVATKMGFVFVLDRATGRPVFPVVERPAPSSDVPGEHASPTQPIPSAPPPLAPQRLDPSDAWGLTFIDRLLCRRQIARLRSDGLYTPPSLRGSIVFPFTGGGVNWGGRRLRLGGWAVHRERHEPCSRGAANSPCRLYRRPRRCTEGRDRTWPWDAPRCRADAAHLDLAHSLQRAALGHTHGR